MSIKKNITIVTDSTEFEALLKIECPSNNNLSSHILKIAKENNII